MTWASQHVSSGLAVDEDWLRLIPTSVPFMAFNFLTGSRLSVIAMATGILVTGCGGGSTDGATSTTASAATIATGTTASTPVDTTTPTTVASTDGSTSVTSAAPNDPATVQSDDTITEAGTATVAAATNTSLTTIPTVGATSGLITVGTTTTSTTTSTATGTTSTPKPVVTTSTGSTGTTTSPVGVTPVKTTGSPVTAAPTVGTRSSVGLNLTGLSYYSIETPTIDLMKKAGAWLTQCNGCTGLPAGASAWDTKEEAALDLDANGWVKSLPAANDTTHHFRGATTALSALGALAPGRYIVRYDGSGTMNWAGGFAKVASASTPGRDVVDLTGAVNSWMTITQTDPTNYLRNIRIYPPGGACANDLTVFAPTAASCNASTGAFVAFENFPATQIWHPQFLQDIKGFRALRFMDWSLTNNVTATTWAQRTPPGARIWTAQTGVPVEAMLDLANLVGADAWINVPPYANDDYATQIGLLAKTHLTGVSQLDLEYANEPWNYAFVATGWMLNQAKAKYATQVAQGVSPYTLVDSWYGERLSQICRALKSGDPQARCVANTQAAASWHTNQVLSCPYAAAEVGHACAKDVDVVAIAPYFGGYISGTKLRSVVATWYADADGGLNKLFQEITGKDANGNAVTAPLNAAGSGAPTGALDQSKSWMVATKAVVDTYGIAMWAYEGGQHLLVPTGDTDTGIQNLFVAANRDPRMGAAYDRMMSDWKSVSGQTFSYYSHVAPPSVYGMWGLKESMTDIANPKWVSAVKNRNLATCNWAGC